MQIAMIFVLLLLACVIPLDWVKVVCFVSGMAVYLTVIYILDRRNARNGVYTNADQMRGIIRRSIEDESRPSNDMPPADIRSGVQTMQIAQHQKTNLPDSERTRRRRLSPALCEAEIPELVKGTRSYSPGKGGQLSTANDIPPRSKSGVCRPCR